MAWDDLVCAACSGRVGDGRCPTCRASRDQLRRQSLPAVPLLLAALVVLLLLVVLQTWG